MKLARPLTLAAIFAVSLLGTSLAAAQPYPGPPPGPRPPGYGPPRPLPGPYPWGGPARPGWRHWRAGDRFYGPRYVINNWQAYRLPPPWRGYQWARSGGEFVMIGTGNGLVGSVVINPAYP